MSGAANARLARRLGLGVAVMLGLSFAAVPFYDWFCRVTGYAGTTGTALAPSAEPLDEMVTVRFDANTDPDMPWQFRPKERLMQIRIGETGLAFFEAYNPTDEPIAGQASFNVAPYSAGQYFSKIACFCFELQVLQPGERIDMPVTFFVDPAIRDDAEARVVTQITLSYTMHSADLQQDELTSTEAARSGAIATALVRAATN